MPIDSASNPFGGGADADDLANAGKGAVVPDKGLDPLADDDLDDAGKGSGGSGEPFEQEDFDKAGGGADESVDEVGSKGTAADDVFAEEEGDALDKLDDNDDVFGDKGGVDDVDDDDFGSKFDDNDDDVDDVKDVDFDIDI